MTNENAEIAREIQIERARIEQEKSRPKPVSRNQVKEAKYVWVGGTVIIDLLTAYLIYTVTGYWYYAVIWALAGAGGLIYSERLKERIGNNKEQLTIGDRGVKISAGMVAFMALVAGAMWVTKSYTSYLSVLIEASAVGLFLFHLWQSYQYQHTDDGYKADNEEALLEENNERRIRESHRAGRVVSSRKVERGLQEAYRKEHGEAFDAAMGNDNDPNQRGRNG